MLGVGGAGRVCEGLVKEGPPPVFSVNCFCESRSSRVAVTKSQAPTVAAVALGALAPSHGQAIPCGFPEFKQQDLGVLSAATLRHYSPVTSLL